MDPQFESWLRERDSRRNVKEMQTGSSEDLQEDDNAHKTVLKWIQLKIQVERQMQRLAAAYFGFWHFWFLFLPSAVLTMASGILAFLSTSDLIGPDNRTLLASVVGCLALVATFLQSLNDTLKYGSRKEMHNSAVLDLKAIYDNLDFTQIKQFGMPINDHDKNKKTIEDLCELYSQVQTGCKSAIPLRVLMYFNTIETRLLTNPLDFEGYCAVYQEATCAVEAYWLFPLCLPDPDSIAVQAFNRVEAKRRDLKSRPPV